MANNYNTEISSKRVTGIYFIASIIKENQPLKFILVGGLNTLIGYCLYALFLAVGLPYYYAMLLTTCLGALINFKTTGSLVFNNKNNKLLLRFILVYLFIYLFTNFSIYLLKNFIPNLYICGILSIMMSSIVSYFCNKKYTFKAQENI